MGSLINLESCVTSAFLSTPLRCSHSGILPRDRASADRLDFEGTQIGVTLHSAMYLPSSQTARNSKLTDLEERPFNSQKYTFELSVNSFTNLF